MTTKDAILISTDIILDGLSASIAEWTAGGTVSYVNPAFCALTGRTREELIGKHFYSVVCPGELGDQWDQPRLEFVQHKAVSGHVVEMQTKNGSALVVSWTTALRFSPSGRLHSILGIGLDITAFARAQWGIADLATALANIYGLGDAVAVTS